MTQYQIGRNSRWRGIASAMGASNSVVRRLARQRRKHPALRRGGQMLLIQSVLAVSWSVDWW